MRSSVEKVSRKGSEVMLHLCRNLLKRWAELCCLERVPAAIPSLASLSPPEMQSKR
jgi:hypothetical protein